MEPSVFASETLFSSLSLTTSAMLYAARSLASSDEQQATLTRAFIASGMLPMLLLFSSLSFASEPRAHATLALQACDMEQEEAVQLRETPAVVG